MVEQKKTYPIGVVSDKTGLSASVIRAWERRYQAVHPVRTGSNRRLYSADDMYRLTLLKRMSDAGMNIGDIAHLSTDQLQEVAGETDPSLSPASTYLLSGGHPFRSIAADEYLEECLNAARGFQQKRLEYTLVKAESGLSQPVLVDEVIIPLIEQVGRLWEQSQFSVGNEHLVSMVLRAFLETRRTRYQQYGGGHRMIVTTPVGQLHELGALLVALTAAARGWAVIYLGPNLPGSQIAEAIRQTRARAVALSLVYPLGDPRVNMDLKVLKRSLPETVTVLIGGRATSSYHESLQEIHAQTFMTIAEFRRYLEETNPG